MIQQSYVIAGLLGRDGTDPGPETRPARCDVRPCLLPRFRDILRKILCKAFRGGFYFRGGCISMVACQYGDDLKHLQSLVSSLLPLAEFVFTNYTLTNPHLRQH